MTDARLRLRAHTATSHALLDELVTGTDPFASLMSYRRFLENHWRARRAVQTRLGGLGPDRAWTDLASGDDCALVEDMSALGSSSTPVAPASPTACPDVGRGVLYVLEGAKLGARILTQRLVSRLGPDVPRTFLEHFSRERWTQACHTIDCHDDFDTMATAATTTFAIYIDVMSERGYPELPTVTEDCFKPKVSRG